MKEKQTLPHRLLSLLLVLALLVSTVPLSAIPALAYTEAQLPPEMWDNSILRALAYTGYNVQWLKDNQKLYDYNFIAGRLPGNTPVGVHILSDIGYAYGGTGSGSETVQSSATPTGLAPNIEAFKATGLDCLDFAAYYLTNYLPNVEGVDISMLEEMNAKYGMGYDNSYFWPAACADLEADGRVDGYHFEVNDSANNTAEYLAVFEKLKPGDLIIMGDDTQPLKHYAIYAGYFDGDGDGHKDAYIIHSGNSRGPEISMIKYMADSAVGSDKQSWPLAFYHFNWEQEPIEETGFIEIYKKDTNTTPLSGAWFMAVDKANNEFFIGPTNKDGYAISAELEFGTYTVTETVFPDGYTSAGETSWTVTLDANTPNGTVTINAVNKLKTGKISALKHDESGSPLSDVTFGIFSNSNCATLVTTITTGSDGTATSSDLEGGVTYYVKETQAKSSNYILDGTVYTVTVAADSVTWVNNGAAIPNYLKRGTVSVTKTAEYGSVAGIPIRLYGTSASGQAVDITVNTDAHGVAVFSNVLTGSYTLVEVDPLSYYVPPAAQSVTVEWNNTTYAAISNSLKKGTLNVTKTSEDGVVEGIDVRLHGISDSGLPVDLTVKTNASGVASFTNIPIGTNYTIEEVGTKAYYVAPAAQTGIAVSWNSTANASIHNALKRGDLQVNKNAEDGTKEGFRFHLYGTSGSGTAVDLYATTNSSGIAVFDDVLIGSYTIEEVDTQNHYIAPSVQSAVISWNAVASAYFDNNLKRGDLQTTKTSEDGKVEGIQFYLHGTSEAGIAVNMYATTDANGVALFEDVPIGSGYTLEEVNTKAYYIAPAAQSVRVDYNMTTSYGFQNTLKRGDLEVTKTSEDNKVSGIRIRLHGTSDSGIPVDVYATTNSAGVAVFESILIGSYTLEEVDTKAYYITPNPQSISVTWNTTAKTSIYNQLKRGDPTVTKTSEDSQVEGKKFRLHGTSDSGIAVDMTVATDAHGIALFEDILIGSNYTIEEIETKDYYIAPAGQAAVIEWNTVTNRSFYNELKRGDLKVAKTAEDDLVAGQRFRLHGTSDSGIAVDEYATADANGIAVFKNILIGSSYILEEVDTPVRYVIPASQTTNVAWNDVTENSFENILKKWRVTITKVDLETRTPQGDSTLAGAMYGLYDGDQLVDTYTTDENGQFTTDYYICGDNWSLREISASEGYNLNMDIVHIDAEADLYTVELNGTSEEVTEEVKTGMITIIKHCDDGSTQIETPEVGAEFEVFLKAAGSYAAAKDPERCLLVCDENGYAETKQLPYGVYTVKQVKSWDNAELLEPFDVYISQEDGIYRYLINNAPFFSFVKIVKVDSETGVTIPYAGAAFHIYDPNGSKVEMPLTYPQVSTIDTFYTNSEGTLITPQELPYGFGYTIVEVAAPTGYVLDQTPIFFNVTPDTAGKEDGITIVSVNRPNTPQKGTITVNKNGEVFSSVTVTDGIYQPVYEVKGLAGAVYDIAAAQDIYTPDGTLRYSKGQVVDTLTTGADGSATSVPLYLGKYEVKEITAPYGMVLNGTVNTVELVYAGQSVSITSASTSFTNDRQKVAISLSKELEQDPHYGIGMNSEILSVTFGLYAAEALTAADGTVIPADSLLEIASCDGNGNITFATDAPVDTKLYVKEHSTDAHYILSDARYPVTFLYAGQDTALVTISVNDGAAFHNEIIRGSIVGKKLDEDGFAICNALFGLFRMDETGFTEQNALLTCTSNEIGNFLFEGVPFGRYIIREIQAAPAFVLNENSFTVTITKNGEVVEVTIENKFIVGTATTTKVDAEYPENKLSGAIFEVYVDVDGNKVFDPAIDLLVGEMTETVTGVYAMKDLRYNGYFLHEKAAPTGFLPDEGYYYFEIRTDSQTVEIENSDEHFIDHPVKGNVQTTKVDAENLEKTLSGAVFEIYIDTDSDGSFNAEIDILLGEMTEDENGTYTMKDLRYGDYLLHEKTAPEGFLPDEGYYSFQIRNHGETVTVENEAGVGFVNQPIKGNVQTDKVDAEHPESTLSGTVFEVYIDTDGDGSFNTEIDTLLGEMIEGDNGTYTMEGLRYGDYFLHEKTAPEGFLTDDGYYLFQIRSHGKTVTVENKVDTGFVNEPIKGSMQTIKVDTENPLNKLSGAVFEVYLDVNGNGKYDAAIDVLHGLLTESVTGTYTISGLRYGSYLLHEKTAPEGFLAATGYYHFEIHNHGETVNVENEAGVGFVNQPIKGSITTSKVDADYPEHSLSGAIFEVYINTDGDGSFNAEVDILLGEIAESDNGSYTMEGLRYGSYFLHEKTAPVGFLPDDGYYFFEIRSNGEIVTVENKEGVGFINQPVKGSVQTVKLDAEDPVNKLSGSEFEVYLDVDDNGKFDAAVDTLHCLLTDNSDGSYFTEGLRYGSYFLHERTAPEGFLADTGYYHFEIRNHGETVTVENEVGVGFVNDPMIGELELTKTDLADSAPLPGVGIRIRNEAGEIIHEGVTDENGIVRVSLRVGKYTYQEAAPLDGYLLDETEYAFGITEHGQTVKVELTNERIPVIDIPNTGDNSGIHIWNCTALVSLSAILLLVVLRRRFAVQHS